MAALSSITRTRCMRESASPDIGRLRRGERQRQGEGGALTRAGALRSEEHTSELQSRSDLVCRLLLEKKKQATHRLICFIDATTLTSALPSAPFCRTSECGLVTLTNTYAVMIIKTLTIAPAVDVCQSC